MRIILLSPFLLGWFPPLHLSMFTLSTFSLCLMLGLRLQPTVSFPVHRVVNLRWCWSYLFQGSNFINNILTTQAIMDTLIQLCACTEAYWPTVATVSYSHLSSFLFISMHDIVKIKESINLFI